MCTKTYDTFIEIKHFPKLEKKQDTFILVKNLLVLLMKFAPFARESSLFK